MSDVSAGCAWGPHINEGQRMPAVVVRMRGFFASAPAVCWRTPYHLKNKQTSPITIFYKKNQATVSLCYRYSSFASASVYTDAIEPAPRRFSIVYALSWLCIEYSNSSAFSCALLIESHDSYPNVFLRVSVLIVVALQCQSVR